MEKVWKRVQSVGRLGASDGAAATTTSASSNTEQQTSRTGTSNHVALEQQHQSRSSRKNGRAPQTIVCGCRVQPCLVHPVLIRVRRSQRSPPPNCTCPSDRQPCPHVPKQGGLRRARRYKLSSTIIIWSIFYAYKKFQDYFYSLFHLLLHNSHISTPQHVLNAI